LYHDPHVDEIELNGRLYRSVPLEEETVKGVDLVVITTDHSSIDYRMLVQNAPVILDTRNATKGIAGREGKVVLL
ncbi:MAG TPA: UDP binding domain-containing protein, partial [Bacillota bacterium]|nr:UDP binding domain-containing protein [Bacillota bacterium]